MSNPQKILLTGSTGFIGRKLCERLVQSEQVCLTLALRHSDAEHPNAHVLGEFTGEAEWSAAVTGVDVVIHCAARAHVLKEHVANPLGSFRETNTAGTLALARQAAAQGVKRFIFLSSIGVNGKASTQPFTANDTPAPAEPYAVSKLEAEQGLWEIQRETGMEVVVIRPPLVYGPDAPGNFGLLMGIVSKGLPLPLAGISNSRSFVSVWNLVDLIATCIDHPKAAGQLFLVQDGQDVSTSDLLRGIGKAQGKPARLFWLPAPLLKAGAILLRKHSMYERLFDSLQVDDTGTRQQLDWTPPVSVDEGLRRCFETQGH